MIKQNFLVKPINFNESNYLESFIPFSFDTQLISKNLIPILPTFNTLKKVEIKGYVSNDSKAKKVLKKSSYQLKSIMNQDLQKSVDEFLSIFIDELSYWDDYTNLLPEIKLDIEEDNAFFEWIFEDFRIGFTVVENFSDSSWFLFLNKKILTGSSLKISFSGDFSEEDYPLVIRKLINFVMRNT